MRKNTLLNFEEAIQKLKDHPDFQNGMYWGKKLADQIQNSEYENIEHALGAKKVFAEQLYFQLGYPIENTTLSDAIGMVAALQQALDKEVAEEEKDNSLERAKELWA